jgi:anthranilate phosphoribosyltransferase
VPDPALTPVMARVLGRLGSTRAWVVSGAEGMDELTITGVNHVAGLDGGKVTQRRLDPAELGLRRASLEDLRGGDAVANAAIIEAILGGGAGAPRDVVVLNAAAALVVGGVAPDLPAGLSRAAASIDGGSARRVLEGLRTCAQPQELVE